MIAVLSAIERETSARQSVQSAEHWLRRLVHYQLNRSFGSKYLTQNNNIASKYAETVKKFTANYDREIDTTSMDQLIDILLHPNLFESHFKAALSKCYPLGSAEARFFLDQVKGVRNDVSHQRGCSERQCEKARCYTADLAEAVQDFFRSEALERDYNVPMIVKFVDSLGNTSNLIGVSENINNRIIDWRKGSHGDLRPGDVLVAEVEIDQSYLTKDYDVNWQAMHYFRQVGVVAEIKITNEHVGEQFELRFIVKTHKDWHRQFGIDDQLILTYRVLPPI